MKYKRVILGLAIFMAGSGFVAMSTFGDSNKYYNGSSIEKYKKPGAPVDITYTTQRVGVGEVSSVSITLVTAVSQGEMRVKVKPEATLLPVGIIKDIYRFDLNKGTDKHPIELKVTGINNGTHYIRLNIEIEGRGMRAFAVPVYVGSRIRKLKKSMNPKIKNGDNLSISRAKETISNK